MARLPISLTIVVLLGCSSDSGTTSEVFCENCIDGDRAHCEFWADRRSEAFLDGYKKCGDDPPCLQGYLDLTGPDAAQSDYASAFCEACAYAGCVETFFQEGHPGYSLLPIGGVGLQSVRDACIPPLRSLDTEQCAATHESCVLDYRLDDSRSGGLDICRTKAE